MLPIFFMGLFFTLVTAQSPTAVPHGEVCAGEIDLMIVVDGSYSVTKENFQLVKQWIKDLAKGFSLEHGHVQIGVVQYSYWYSNRPMYRQRFIRTEIPLGAYQSLRRFNVAVDRIRYQGYRTYTAHAINKTVDYDFQGPRSRYPRARRAIILLTDGRATDAADLPLAVEHAEKVGGVSMFAVGVGNYSIDELRLITHGHDSRIFELSNFTELAGIVFKLPRELQGICDCDDKGSLTKECDMCTRKCECKPNVVGRRCDKCAEGFYGIESGEGCKPCGCNPYGTIATNGKLLCNPDTGKCNCIDEVAGDKCDRCPKGYTGFPECHKCECNGWAEDCDSFTGICFNCKGGRVGRTCHSCPPGQFISEDGTCASCPCNGNIDTNDPRSCDVETGECLKCLHNTAGKNCEKCAEFYYGNSFDRSCKQCDCESKGSDLTQCTAGEICRCDPNTGQCPCLFGVTGLKCERCKEGYWGHWTREGCKSCGCNVNGSSSTMCDKHTGQCTCKLYYSGFKCDSCVRGFNMNDNGECIRLTTTTTTTTTTSTTTNRNILGDDPNVSSLSPSSTPKTTKPTTTVRATTRKTTFRPTTTTARPIKQGCYTGCFLQWPSYCRGWLCRRRWPYTPQQYSTQRCYSTSLSCRSSIGFQTYKPMTYTTFDTSSRGSNTRSTASTGYRNQYNYGRQRSSYGRSDSTQYYMGIPTYRPLYSNNKVNSRRKSKAPTGYSLYRRMYKKK